MYVIALFIVLNEATGQIKPKSRLAGCRFSQNKNGRIYLFATKVKKQTKQIRWFVFWENLRIGKTTFGFI